MDVIEDISSSGDGDSWGCTDGGPCVGLDVDMGVTSVGMLVWWLGCIVGAMVDRTALSDGLLG